MDREQILSKAQEFGLSEADKLALIRLAMFAWREGVRSEREECAELAIEVSERGIPDDMPEDDKDFKLALLQVIGGVMIADAIRRRGMA